MDRRRQGASVSRARLVELEVGNQRTWSDLVRQQVVKHQDVGLLQHLSRRDALGPEEKVGGDRSAGRDLGEIAGIGRPLRVKVSADLKD